MAKSAQAYGQDELSNQKLAAINRGLAAVERVHQKCERAERCGRDMAQNRAEAEEIRNLLNLYKAEYFPGAS